VAESSFVHTARAWKRVEGVIGHVGSEELTIPGGARFPEASLKVKQLLVHGTIVAEIGGP
jgi:hypothetical protein